jgi:hypothetical protein
MVTATFTFDDVAQGLSHAGLPQLYFNQLHLVRQHIQLCQHQNIHAITATTKLTRRKLLLQPDWNEWESAKFKQLDSYEKQQMFGTPVFPPPGAAIFYWVWIYSIKTHENDRKKARAVCDGSTRGSLSVIHGQTFAPTPDMVDFRLQLALSAVFGLQLFCADVGNAFAEATAPKQQYYMWVDAQFANWWTNRHPEQLLQPGMVIPIEKNLQGHPEAPRQWSLHIDHLLCNVFKFTPTTHAQCL